MDERQREYDKLLASQELFKKPCTKDCAYLGVCSVSFSIFEVAESKGSDEKSQKEKSLAHQGDSDSDERDQRLN